LKPAKGLIYLFIFIELYKYMKKGVYGTMLSKEHPKINSLLLITVNYLNNLTLVLFLYCESQKCMQTVNKINKIYNIFLSDKRKEQFERLIFFVAIVAFISHFTFLLLANWGVLPGFLYDNDQELNPIISLYTPFSIILLYEVFLLIYYLPHSITVYISKQYEIMTIILLRKIFEGLATLSINTSEWSFESLRVLLISLGGLLFLFFLIFCFYKLGGHKEVRPGCENLIQWRFLAIKKVLSLGLLLLFVVLFIRSLFQLSHLPFAIDSIVSGLKSINNTFFQTFFTALILTEVLLLLFTFNLSDRFSKVIRNSGFIVSTILLKISFSVDGLLSLAIILMAVIFGLVIMAIYRLFEMKLKEKTPIQ